MSTGTQSPAVKTGGVMIVDDHEGVRVALRALLGIDDLAVAGEAADGLEALTLAARVRPDVVILDGAMPRLDGAGAAPLLRALLPGVRILAFTSGCDAQPDWADAFLPKDRIHEVADILHGLAAPGAGEKGGRVLKEMV
ncbi:MAG: response regulator [Actinomycetota bacterium]